MASDLKFIEFLIDQLEQIGETSFRKMFGEFVIYHKGKVVALVCDNQLFVKQTEAGRSFIGNVVEAPPYPGAKPAFLIEEQIENREWLCQLIRLTEKELPPPRPKKKRKHTK